MAILATAGGLVSNPSKAKGTAFETAVVGYFNERGIPCERRALHGNTDKGDIAAIPEWTLELKNRRRLAIGGAVDEAALEAANAHTRWYAAIVKRPRKGNPAEAFAVMPLSELVSLILELQSTQQRIAGG